MKKLRIKEAIITYMADPVGVEPTSMFGVIYPLTYFDIIDTDIPLHIGTGMIRVMDRIFGYSTMREIFLDELRVDRVLF